MMNLIQAMPGITEIDWLMDFLVDNTIGDAPGKRSINIDVSGAAKPNMNLCTAWDDLPTHL